MSLMLSAAVARLALLVLLIMVSDILGPITATLHNAPSEGVSKTHHSAKSYALHLDRWWQIYLLAVSFVLQAFPVLLPADREGGRCSILKALQLAAIPVVWLVSQALTPGH
jgi:hypothetical protein